jgi:hypothetical protein
MIASGSDESDPTPRATSAEERKAVRLESRLAQEPANERLLLATMKAWISAAGKRFAALESWYKPLSIPDAMVEDNEAGLRAWDRYLKQTGGKADRDVAETAALAYFQLLEIGSTDPSTAKANAEGAARAQEIVCKQDTTLYTLSDLAVYRYFNGEFAKGDEAARRAAASAVREEAAIKPRGVIGQLNEYKERGEKFVARVRRGFKTLEETGEETLEHPIKAYGAPAGINGYEPTPAGESN